MDLIKIGKFISEQRKSKGLSQVELADRLNLSNKTISKWERGNGFPDVSLLLPLCEELDISVNELLSGQKLEATEYHERAEESLIEAAKWIAGAPEYYLQQFKDSGDILAPGSFSAFDREEMLALAEAVRPYVPSVQVRGV